MFNRLTRQCGQFSATSKQTGQARPPLQLQGGTFRRLHISRSTVKRIDMATQVATKWAEDVVTGTTFNENLGISVTSHFDSGNADVLDMNDPLNIKLRIHPDPYTENEGCEHFQWFYYRVAGAKNKQLRMHLTNAGQSSYADGWKGYKARASYDRKDWFMVPTEYDAEQGVLTIMHKPIRDIVYYAYFEPYTYGMHQDLVASLQDDDRVCLKILGCTHDGHDIEMLRIGKPEEGKRKIWLTARQHPGESMAEFYVEGFMRRLLDRNDALARKVLSQAVFYVIPNMNPDGTWRGHLRTNADGINLNRAWMNPTAEEAPEVFYVLKKMDELGVDMYLDIHGDEEQVTNFIHGNSGIPSWTQHLADLQHRFQETYHKCDPTFSVRDSYGEDAPGTANLAIAARQVGERFKCVAATLEMPFKDIQHFEDEVSGWSGTRAAHFGASLLHPLADIIPDLR